jgi:UDP-N-acetylmuramoyl-tripeptide--D-alanyl-D-alanine ligase
MGDREHDAELRAQNGGHMELTLRQMAALLGAPVHGKPDAKVARRKVVVCTDSRTVKPGTVFWALQGEKFDGHAFVEQGFKQGGDAAVVNKEWLDQNGTSARVYVPVGDTQEALTALARSYAERFRIPKIAITGSNGKTTTKDMIAAVLRRSGKVLATEGNFNNHVGLPLTLFGLRSAHRYAVLEMGMSNPGEIRALSETAKPGLAVVTNIGLAHLEGMGSREAIRDEKLSIIAGFPGGRGTLFLNVDDPMLCDFRAPAKTRVVTFGVERGQVKPTDVKLGPDGCASFRIGRTVFHIPVPGMHNVYNALAAIAVGLQLRVPKADIAAALASFAGPRNRMQVRRIHGVTLLDDCYNANPTSMRAALATLAAQETSGRRVAVLGDMLELGAESTKLHEETGHYLVEMGVDELFTFGDASRHLNQAARSKGMPRRFAHHYSDFDLMAEELASSLAPGDVVLVKGSRGMKLERVSEALRLSLRSGSRIGAERE